MQLLKLIKLQLTLIKEMVFMTFTTKSRIAQSYVILILAGEMTIEDVPDFSNLRAVVLQILSGETETPAV